MIGGSKLKLTVQLLVRILISPLHCTHHLFPNLYFNTTTTCLYYLSIWSLPLCNVLQTTLGTCYYWVSA